MFKFAGIVLQNFTSCHGRGLNDDADVGTYCPYGHILLISLRPGHLVGVCTGSLWFVCAIDL